MNVRGAKRNVRQGGFLRTPVVCLLLLVLSTNRFDSLLLALLSRNIKSTPRTTNSSAIAETALPGGLVMAKSGRRELGDNIYGHYRSIFKHRDVFGQQSNRIR